MNKLKIKILIGLVLEPRTMELEPKKSQQGFSPHHIKKAEIITRPKTKGKKRNRRSFPKVPLKYLC